MDRVATFVFIIVLTVASVPNGIAADEAEHLSKSGVQRLVAGDAQQAVDLLSRAISLNSTEYRYYNDRGVAFKRLAQIDDAIADYTRALEIKPDFTNALNNRGVAYLEKGLHDKALEDFTRALELGDFSSQIYTNRGLAYALMGDQNKALVDFKKAISIRPVDSRAFIFTGDTLLKMGKETEAFEMYLIAAGLAKDPKIGEQIEARLSGLEKKVFTSESLQGPRPSGKSDAKIHKEQPAKPSRSASRSRDGHTAQVAASDQRPLAASASYSRSRDTITKRLRPEEAELYRRGEDFLKKSDAPKALLMYEDALQLAQRHRDQHAEAWTLVEIGRCHAALGDQLIGARYLEQAVSRFDRLKAVEEKAAALAELASIRKPGGPDRASRTPPTPERRPAASIEPPKPRAAGNVTTAQRVQSPAAKPPAVSPPSPPASTSPSPSGPALGLSDKPTSSPDKTAQTKVATGPREKATPVAAPQTKQPPTPPPDRTRPKRSQRVNRPGEEVIRQILKQSRAQPVETTPDMQPQGPAQITRAAPAPSEIGPIRIERAVEPAKQRKSLEDLLAELKRLRAAGNERGMIGVLEALASEFEKDGIQDKALICLGASIAFRDKLGMPDGMDKTLLRAGTLKEKAGRVEDALADFTRALATAQKEKKADLEKMLRHRAELMAKRSGLETKPAMDEFAALWKARADGDEESETRALQRVAALYERAGRAAVAAEYYARTAALMAAQRASLLKKAGKPAEAEESIKQALGEFKTLDYSRYLLIMRKSKEPGPISRHE